MMLRSFLRTARGGWWAVPSVVAVMVLAHVAFAQDHEPKPSRDLEGQELFYVHVADQAKEGCWPRPTETKLLVENRLRQNGIEIVEAGEGRLLLLYAQAYAVNADDECVWFVRLDMPYTDWEGGHHLMYGTKRKGQERVTESLLSLANRFLADWAFNNQ